MDLLTHCPPHHADCNDAYLVIHSSGLAAHPTSLGSVFSPPGGGSCPNGANPCGYADQCVTRDYATAYAVYKWPLAPTLLSTASGTVNNAQYTFTTSPTAMTTSKGVGDQNNLLYLNGLTSMPTSGPVAISVSGQNIFPTQNNKCAAACVLPRAPPDVLARSGGLTFPSCETDMCNAHAGQGFDYHYHGDPYGPQCLYSCANYSTLQSHPPLIGYGLDGVPIFGRYLDAGAPGGSLALDDCGGHVHTGIGDAYLADGVYHYHAFVSNITSMNYAAYAYVAYLYGPHMCWKGDITTIPHFFEANANPTARSDYTSGQIKPCSGNANMYVAPGYTINGVSGSGFNYAGKTYTTGAGSSGGVCSQVASTLPGTSPSPTPSPGTSPSVPVAYISAAVSLSGYTTATFGTGEAQAFRTAMATKTGASAVTITGVAAASGSGRRRTHADGVVVSFTLTTTTSAGSTAAAAAAAISVADLTSAGLAVTAVAFTTNPAPSSSAPVDATASLPTTQALRPASAGWRAQSVGAVALACAVAAL